MSVPRKSRPRQARGCARLILIETNRAYCCSRLYDTTIRMLMTDSPWPSYLHNNKCARFLRCFFLSLLVAPLSLMYVPARRAGGGPPQGVLWIILDELNLAPSEVVCSKCLATHFSGVVMQKTVLSTSTLFVHVHESGLEIRLFGCSFCIDMHPLDCM